MADLKRLVWERGQVKGRLTRIKNFFEGITDVDNISYDVLTQLGERFSDSETILSDYQQCHASISMLDESTAPEEHSEAFLADYYNIIPKIRRFLADKNKPPEVVLSDTKECRDSMAIKLPPVQLPTFTGVLEEWDEFHDTFDSLINQNSQLSEIEKFRYLVSAVKGEAAQALKSLRVTTENYSVAWLVLKKRFENKKLIVQNNIRALFELEYVKRESRTELQRALDSILKITHCLKKYNQPTVDSLLIYIISVKLTANTRSEWGSYKIEGDFPTFGEFLQFLENRCQRLGALEIDAALFPANKLRMSESRAHVSTAKQTPGCVYCKESHAIYNCEPFIKLDVNSRIASARQLRLCLNCLKRNHKTKSCTLLPCQKCGKKHNTILHLEFDRNSSGHNQTISDNEQKTNEIIGQAYGQSETVVTHKNAISEPYPNTSSANHSACPGSASQILLSTASVQITDTYGNTHNCRCLLDPGSQSSFITSELCNRLGLQRENFNLTITGVGQLNSAIKYKTLVSIKSRTSNYKADVTCLVLDNITERLPTMPFDLHALNIPNTIQLADPKCNVSMKIDLLIGADVFWELLCNGQHNLGKNMPILQKTQLGWILGGRYVENNCEPPLRKTLVHFNKVNLQDQLEKFWNLEECGGGSSYSKYSQEEKYCEDHFSKTHKRTDTFPRRFIVDIPLKDNAASLGESKEFALKRLYSLERKLERDVKLKADYVSFLREYEGLGHMTKIDTPLISHSPKYYLPHHAVLKETSATTKVRVVFDASMKTSGSAGLSLNDVQCVGPTIQDDIFSILLRFRNHEFVISADIAKMYRQILVNSKQRHLQLIWWRSNSAEDVSCYQLNTITFGMAASSFMAIRCLKQLAIEYREIYPAASHIIENDFYVDDLLTGFDSKETAVRVKNEISEILNTAGFDLRKWASNDPSILNGKNADKSSDLINISGNVGTLGILWNPSEDKLQYFAKDLAPKMGVTKRTILSCIAQIFDPLGLLGPIIIVAKMIIQRLWQHKLSWDESIPLDLHTTFINLRNQLHIINRLDIPRQVIVKGPVKIELHGFCDSSERAYGACVYIRSVNQLNLCEVKLLCAKSRVAPLKNISLPRLELCGALLLANLMHKVKSSLRLDFSSIVYWCDSTVTLHWIRAAPNKWKTFVANRVAEIQNLTSVNEWRHISTEHNPADLISRGLEPSQLEGATLWWKGPYFLSDKDFELLEEQNSAQLENVPEKRTVVNVVANSDASFLFKKYSSLWTLNRIVAYWFRFVNNARSKPENVLSGPLSTSELNSALAKLLKLAQGEAFSTEVTNLLAKRDISPKSSILSLNPFIDEQGLLRVGGRIQNSEFSYTKKHPVIIPAKHALTKLIVRYEHIRLLHGGVNLMLASLREKYWIVAGKNTIKQIIHECVTCFKAKPKTLDYIMGSLPKNRITPAPPFYNCGVDYAGPILIKNKLGRGSKLIKAYICVFVCFATKAMHIELANDLSTNEFLASFRRFVARRGLPLNIYSDNGGNFVGANSELQELKRFLENAANQAEIVEVASKENVSWHFIPSRSPHFGGLWEAGVKSIKGHLRRVVGNTHLTFNELYTLLTQIEAILNSRPLSPLSSDPNDMQPLTPSHFLIGRPMTLVPEPDLAEIANNRLSKYQHIQKLMQHFWKRWSLEYIGEMQNRTKWKKMGPAIVRNGCLALLRNDNLPPLKWELGRVVDLHPGPDGIIRVVSLKTVSGHVMKRALNTICVLPIT